MKPEKAAELISQSFDRALDDEESAELNQHLASNSDSKGFAMTSRTIQRVVSDVSDWTTSGEPATGDPLSEAAKIKITDTIVHAIGLQLIANVPPEKQKSKKVLELAGRHAPDLAFASVAFQSGYISQEWLVEATQSWDRDREPFADHLVQQGMLSGEQRHQIELKATQLLGETLHQQWTETQMIDEPKPPISETRAESDLEIPNDEFLSGLGQTMGLSTDSSESGASSGTSSGKVRQLESRFTLIRKLGEGGLGKVWLARDEQLKRMVAIKETNELSSSSPIAVERFRREAEITGRLEHPNIVPLYQFGSDSKSDRPFYAMRFLGKRNLGEAIAEFHERNQGELEKVGLHKLLTAFVGICQAIAYAHSRGVIHRDLKPDNVALDNFGQVIVLDWGLAKIAEESELHAAVSEPSETDQEIFHQTLAGQVIGTPMYMSPEQASGDHENVDEKTDVYGLGAILFAVLTGLAPHQNSHGSMEPSSQNLKALLQAISQNPTPAASHVNPRVPKDLERICMNAMSKSRHGRYSSVSELADEIQRWMAGQDERRQKFENMRLSGRELKVNISASIRDLETNVRFMSILPPIQEIINVISARSQDGETADSNEWWKKDESMQTWRERLGTIFRGLLQSNNDYQSVAYCHFHDNSFQEIVRLERHSAENSNIRSVPISRLSRGLISKFALSVMKQKPEEGFIAVTTHNDDSLNSFDDLSISAGVPVFDAHSEEAFGFVVIETRFRDLVEQSFRISGQNYFQLLVLDEDNSIIYHRCRESGQIESSFGKLITDLFPQLENKTELILAQDEFIDELDGQVYTMQIPLAHRTKKLTFVFLQLDVHRG